MIGIEYMSIGTWNTTWISPIMDESYPVSFLSREMPAEKTFEAAYNVFSIDVSIPRTSVINFYPTRGE